MTSLPHTPRRARPFARAILCLLAALAALTAAPPLTDAQSDADAWAFAALNLRAGPGTAYTVLAELPAGEGLVLQARSADAQWLLGYTAERTIRGWVAAPFVTLRAGLLLADLPVSTQVLDEAAAHDIPPALALAYEAVDLNDGADLMRARAAIIDLADYPIVPDVTGTARRIFAQGQAAGRDPHAIAKVGDCNSVGYVFLHPFGEGRYQLGAYGDLVSVIAQYGDSFDALTYAAHNGLNAMAVLDPLWANPAVCEAGESPLRCEYRLRDPSVAVIMFGTNDMLALDSVQFDRSLRRVVSTTMEADIVPVLSTFPRNLSLPERSILFNQIVVRIALDFDIPLINLWRALEPLPDHGIAPDGFHLSGPLTAAGDFSSAENLRTGFPMRNLVTLQALDAIWQGLTP